MKAINNLEASNGCEFNDLQVTKNFMFLRQGLKETVIKETLVIFHFYLSENTIKEYIKISHEAGELFSTHATDKGTVYILQRGFFFPTT